MTNLTKDLREAIIFAALEKSPQKIRLGILRTERVAAARAALEATLPKGWGKTVAAIAASIAEIQKSIPRGLRSDGSLTAEKLAAGLYAKIQSDYAGTHIYIDGQRHHCDIGERVYFTRNTLTSDEPNAAAYLALQNEKETLSAEVDTQRAEVRAVVESCRTVKSLLEVWPECAELVPPKKSACPPC